MSHLAAPPRPVAETRAVSPAGHEIETAREYAYAIHSFGSPGNAKSLNELASCVYAHGLFDSRLGLTTFQQARIFLALIPSGVPHPEFSVDPDGDIAIEWYEDDNVLSISLGHSGRLAYVFERNGAVASGTGYLSSAIPDELLEMINTFQ